MRHTAHKRRGSDDASPNLFMKYFLFRFGTFHTNKPLLQAVALQILILSQWQKECFSHQPHSQAESAGEGIEIGDAVHLVHVFLELLKCFLLLVRECTVQLFAIPGYQLQ